MSTPGNDVCHRWPSKLKHIFSCEDCFGRLAFWSKVVYIIPVQREDHGSKVFQWKIGNFRSMCPKTLIMVISGYHDLGILFCSWKRFGRFGTVSKSWCIPNYQISIFSKTRHFFLLSDFWRIRERVSESGILWPIAWVDVIKRFIRFFKIVPPGVPHFLFKWFHSERKCLLRRAHFQSDH